MSVAALTVGGTSVSVWQLVVLALAALFVGFAKTAIGGFGSVSVALFAAVLPARSRPVRCCRCCWRAT